MRLESRSAPPWAPVVEYYSARCASVGRGHASSGLRWGRNGEVRSHTCTHEPDAEAVAILRIRDVNRQRNVLLDCLEREKQLLRTQATRSRFIGRRGEGDAKCRIEAGGSGPSCGHRHAELSGDFGRK